MDGQPGSGQRVRPVPMEKKIYGVPVFPGSTTTPGHSPGGAAGGGALKSPPGGAPTERNGRPMSLFDALAEAEGRRGVQAAPAAQAVTAAPPAAAVAPAAPPAPPAPPQQRWKLRHMDFAPSLVKSKKDEEYERFPTLIDRANQWSVSNPQCLVFSAETVSWTTMDRPLFTDAGVLLRSMSSDKKTKVLRGLRLWYFIYDETFHDKTCSPGPYKLGYINYTLDGKQDTILSLLAKVNGDMFKRTVAGKIVKIETLTLLADVTDADVCAWTEQPDKARDYVSFLRLYYIFKKDSMEDCSYGDIGIRDFQPVFDQRTPHNAGYETFADLWSKAARWLYTNPQLKLINAQGVFVKLKKESEAQGSTTLWDRCNHREHGSAYGSLTHQKTEYYQILRIVYHQPPSAPAAAASAAQSGAAPASGAASESAGPRKLYYKTFSPAPLKRVGGVGGAGGEDSDPTPPEGLYEDLRQMEDKTNAWLIHSDAKVASVETVPTRLLTGGQESLGAEATFVYNDRERNQSKESWRVNVRLYIDGEFKDPPPAWRNSIVEKSVALTSGGGGGASGGGGGANHTTEL